MTSLSSDHPVLSANVASFLQLSPIQTLWNHKSRPGKHLEMSHSRTSCTSKPFLVVACLLCSEKHLTKKDGSPSPQMFLFSSLLFSYFSLAFSPRSFSLQLMTNAPCFACYRCREWIIPPSFHLKTVILSISSISLLSFRVSTPNLCLFSSQAMCLDHIFLIS